ncbi:hypothetical protein Cgig2_005947 [Carnegiea gigantea]|uniref:Uncharacterized protein n=1 Tax=Carnegiea gigantea TaxID=171969 RepID=A0A9Q1KIX7_9CARY|nr:hypothetical protein Cgig2_005947 [Carnegiea gigantea]
MSTTPVMSGLQTLSNPAVSMVTLQRQWFPSLIRPHGLPILSKRRMRRKISINANWNGYGNGNGRNGLNNSNGESNGNGNGNGINSDEDDESKRENGWPGLNLRWARLLLDPDPDNVLAVGLTGLLTWASVQVVWQLLVVSLAIVIAGLKFPPLILRSSEGTASYSDRQISVMEIIGGQLGEICNSHLQLRSLGAPALVIENEKPIWKIEY